MKKPLVNDNAIVHTIFSKNSVREAVRAHTAKHLYVTDQNRGDPIVLSAKEGGVPISICTSAELFKLAGTSNHQGFVAETAVAKPCSTRDLIQSCKGKDQPLIVMLDGIQDPHNLGAILRSCDAFGVDGIIMKAHGEVPLNSTVSRVSTGAIEYVKVAVVPNLSQAISELKDAGFWIVSTDGSADKLINEVDYRCPICLVVGSEGFGISRLVLKNSDFVVKIPMVGHVNSLNASVSAGIAIAEIFLSRR